MVLQHADDATQRKYLKVFREAVKNRNASPSDLALLEDRINVHSGRPQVYGSQLTCDKDNKCKLFPIEDPDHVDQRRHEVGLMPLAEYLKLFNTFQIRQHINDHSTSGAPH